jgi:hypothetical protein
MDKRYNEVVYRISRINWRNIGLVEKKSNVALAKEYIRRAALLVKTYSLNVKFPFYSAAQAIGKSQQIDIVGICPQLENLDNAFVKRFCECYLEWAFLTDTKEPAAIQFCDLYEPLIKLFERGGTIGLHHGEVVVGRYAFPLVHWSSLALEEPIDISDSGLEIWDK